MAQNESQLSEANRIHALESYQILDSDPDEDCDDITKIASYSCQSLVALIIRYTRKHLGRSTL